MGKKKTSYELIVNNASNMEAVFTFEYANVKGTKIMLTQNGMKISTSTSAKITGEMIIENQNRLFEEAIKRGMILYIMMYSQALNVNEFSFSINGVVQTYSSDHYPMTSVISGDLMSAFDVNWHSTVVSNYILSYKERYRKPSDQLKPDLVKKEAPRLFAALMSLISAKSKIFECERFQFLWISMNGLYGYVSQLFEPSGKKDKKRRLSEVDEMSILWQCLKWNTTGSKWCILKRDKPIIASKIIKILKNIDETRFSIDELKTALFEGEYADTIVSKIHAYLEKDEKAEKYDISSKMYITFFLPYYIRCAYFHANKPFPLLEKRNDEILHALKIINRILEDFIEEQLLRWMDINTYNCENEELFSGIVYGECPSQQ